MPSVERAGEPLAAPPRRHPFLWVVWACSALSVYLFTYGVYVLALDGRTTRSFGWTEVQRGDGWYVKDVGASGPADAL